MGSRRRKKSLINKFKGLPNRLKRKIILRFSIALLALVLILSVLAFAIMSINSFMQNTAGVYFSLFDDEEEEDEQYDDDWGWDYIGCECTCDLDSGPGYDYNTGTLDPSNVHSQIIHLMKAVENEVGYNAKYMYGISEVESGGMLHQPDKLFIGGARNIYTNLMVVSDRARAKYAGGDIRTGRISKASPAVMIGPFQISSMYYDAWAAYAPDHLIVSAGGQVDTTITNRQYGGNPAYLPDATYGIMNKLKNLSGGYQNDLANKVKNWGSLPDQTKHDVTVMLYGIAYHGGNAGYNYAMRYPAILNYFADFSIAYNQNKDQFKFQSWNNTNGMPVKEVIDVIDPTGSKGYWDAYLKYGGQGLPKGETSYGIDWVYGIKLIYFSDLRYEYALKEAGGSVTRIETGSEIPGETDKEMCDCCKARLDGSLNWGRTPDDGAGDFDTGTIITGMRMAWPSSHPEKVVTSHFNPNRVHPVLKTPRPHNGVDIRARRPNDRIIAALDGKVVISTYHNGLGNYIKIDHGTFDGKRLYTLYSHNSKNLVKKDQSVKRGQEIAIPNSTGLSSGDHLHFEVHVDNSKVNPMLEQFLGWHDWRDK